MRDGLVNIGVAMADLIDRVPESVDHEEEPIVARLEQGELPLEESLRQFERGVELTRLCQQALSQAEQKIRVLAKGADGEVVEKDFDAPDAG